MVEKQVEKLLKASSSSPRKHGKNVMCYRCGEKGHRAEICRKEATRFVCGAFGHRSFYCPRRGKQGNQVILFLVLQPYEDMVRNVEHLRKCAVSMASPRYLQAFLNLLGISFYSFLFNYKIILPVLFVFELSISYFFGRRA